MSWAEDYGIDAYDSDFSHLQEIRESQWRDGFHVTKKREVISLSDMTIEHLQRTINHFSELDSRPLKDELNKRK